MMLRRSFQIISEMKEFASFASSEQRYIRRSLENAHNGAEAAERWARHIGEKKNILTQARLYSALLPTIRAQTPDDLSIGPSAKCLAPLISLSAFDLQQGYLGSFNAYGFLYERLLGAALRPWLPSAFLAAAALPSLHPSQRNMLIKSMSAIDVAAHGWSSHEPVFMPEWVDKVPAMVS